MRNIEIKAQYADFVHARECVEKLKGKYLETIQQRDVYFQVASGRMKLRYIEGKMAYLVAYKRDNQQEVRESEYYIYETESPEKLEQALLAVHHILATVEKVREVHLIDNVRVHLDQVEGIGQFIEFEAVLVAGKQADGEKEKLENYIAMFEIERENLIDCSYLDMVL